MDAPKMTPAQRAEALRLLAGVGAGASTLDALRHAATDAANYDRTTEDLIAKLSAWNWQVGLRIFQAETDTVQAILEGEPADLPAFAAEVYAFCPDIVDQGVGTVEKLAEEIGRSRRLYLWWD